MNACFDDCAALLRKSRLDDAMPKVVNFYIDDSGTRKPDRVPAISNSERPNFFALGGTLVNEEVESEVRTMHVDFCRKWRIEYPLHSVEIRNSRENFGWLSRNAVDRDRFMTELGRFLCALPVTGLACVVDRPGYDARYRASFGRRQWHLCQTAFCITVERAAKFARSKGRKLRVLPERCNKKDDARLTSYYKSLRTVGPPFDPATSACYQPLTANELSDTLYEFAFKAKSSPMAQVADLYLWPLAKAGYDSAYRPYQDLKMAKRLIECVVPEAQQEERGTKYSCFELVNQQKRGT